MFYFSDAVMYVRYFKKTAYLNILKKTKGLDFVGRIENSAPKLRGYEGCYPVNPILNKLKIKSSDSIIDIGCGKGLFLYYASKYHFNRIDGVEYSEKLTRTAERNIRTIKDKRIHIYQCDARDFSGYNQYNYFFINNPFSADIMEEVAVKIKNSYALNKRKIYIIYQFPFNKDVFLKHDFKMLYEKFPNSILTFG